MIKVNDKIINFKVKVLKSKKTFKFSMSHITRLKHVSLIVCKMLNLDRFNTTISYTLAQFPNKITEVSTLR